MHLRRPPEEAGTMLRNLPGRETPANQGQLSNPSQTPRGGLRPTQDSFLRVKEGHLTATGAAGTINLRKCALEQSPTPKPPAFRTFPPTSHRPTLGGVSTRFVCRPQNDPGPPPGPYYGPRQRPDAARTDHGRTKRKTGRGLWRKMGGKKRDKRIMVGRLRVSRRNVE